MRIRDHSEANEKRKALASSKQVQPESPSAMQKASKTKLDMMSGDAEAADLDLSAFRGKVVYLCLS
jgi:predicted outer membrane protein